MGDACSRCGGRGKNAKGYTCGLCNGSGGRKPNPRKDGTEYEK